MKSTNSPFFSLSLSLHRRLNKSSHLDYITFFWCFDFRKDIVADNELLANPTSYSYHLLVSPELVGISIENLEQEKCRPVCHWASLAKCKFPQFPQIHFTFWLKLCIPSHMEIYRSNESRKQQKRHFMWNFACFMKTRHLRDTRQTQTRHTQNRQWLQHLSHKVSAKMFLMTSSCPRSKSRCLQSCPFCLDPHADV